MGHANACIADLIAFDVRHEMFKRASRFVDYEMVEQRAARLQRVLGG
jgi:hypothetical protein